jgi:putative membrane protein
MWVQTGSYHLGSLYWLIAVIVIFIIALIALIVAGRALARARAATGAGTAYSRGAPGGPGAPGTGPDDRPLPESFRMLDERYAKGEISREEYMQRQADLQSKV